MAGKEANNDAPNDEPTKASMLTRLRDWTAGRPLRSIMVGGGLLVLTLATVATWVTLAALAAPRPIADLDETLEALDNGEIDLAHIRANRLQNEIDLLEADEHGGPLYVLGVIKAQEADAQPLPERAHELYRIAALYLTEARRLGVPEERGVDALYQLGRTLTEGGQYSAGIEALDEALELDPSHNGEIHRLLGEAHFFDAEPDSLEVLDHFDQAIASGELDDKHRGSAHLRRALTLGRLSRFDEGIAEAAKTDGLVDPAERWKVEAQLRVGVVEKLRTKPGRVTPEVTAAVEAAERAIAEARRLDPRATRITASVHFLQGRLRELMGLPEEAIELYSDVRRKYGPSPEGIAASIAEADLLRSQGLAEEALEAYRRTAVAVRDTSAYQSDLLPLGDLQARFIAAKAAFNASGEFASALSLVDHLSELFGYAKRLELRAVALQTWGRHLLDKAAQERQPPAELLSEGRRRLRGAGMSFERLAQVRYASEDYTDFLWQAAEAYFAGQSYSRAAEVLVEYLKNEPRQRNAVALQRLGQSYLALGKAEEAISVFEECVEFYPQDAAVFQSRLDGARAHRLLGQDNRAETLLIQNLIGSKLYTTSPEWRDSKFELGRLLHANQEWDKAINNLEEAVARYSDDPTSRQAVKEAKYLIAESYRNAAEKPLADFEAAKSVSDREKAHRLIERYLNEAIRRYNEVQRSITLHGDSSELDRAMLRNCYMLSGAALFDLGRYEEAVRVFSSVSTLYQNEPFVLETMVQIANCWRRLGDAPKARGAIEQALQVLKRLPAETDFLTTTSHSRPEWDALLSDMRQW